MSLSLHILSGPKFGHYIGAEYAWVSTPSWFLLVAVLTVK